jgi:hypothetical protein
MLDELAVLTEGRTAAEDRMKETCTITAAGADPVLNEESGEYESPAAAVSYTGPCRVKFGNQQPRDVDAAGQALVEQAVELHLPVSTSVAVGVGHMVDVTASVTDPGLPGMRFRVLGEFAGTTTARRLPVEVVSESG